MKYIKQPNVESWAQLIKRPELEKDKLESQVTEILQFVREGKDEALRQCGVKYDGVEIDELLVSDTTMEEAICQCSDQLKNAIQLAKANIEKFHLAQKITEPRIETMNGVDCWRRSVGIEKVGLYIPGGSAPLFSTILMLGIPAKIAGCKDIILCSPPDKNGQINPVILYTAQLVGIKRIYKVGGAQAIAAMAYGTESIPQVYKIFGPGNQYVTMAKSLIQKEGMAIDMPAGPSEVLVITDSTGIPEFIAADLLSQAEHGPDSQVVLLSTDENVINKTLQAIKEQIETLPRKNIVSQSILNSQAILLNSMEECIQFSNLYAPEHLIIASDNAEFYEREIVNAGSVFLGHYSCESAGDYASGTNHTLPTNKFSRNYSGVSLDSFVKKITYQKVTKQGLLNIGPAIEIMAEAEGLVAHKNAVSIRLKQINDV